VEHLSIKHDSYFEVYEELFRAYVGKPITFVEVGVLNGGSLFMWRKYFGAAARIIGIDLNPVAKQWIDHGFEIVIGDQSDPKFWDEFFRSHGPVDILLDDGGHTNDQQITAVVEAIRNVRDGGLVVVEDVHTSYWRAFGNPSKRSFISFAKRVIDSINSRFPSVKAVRNDYGKRVYSVTFYESIVALRIDSRKCFECRPTTNKGRSVEAADFRYGGSLMWHAERWHGKCQKNLRRLPAAAGIARAALSRICYLVFQVLSFSYSRMKSRKLRGLFR
jgi:hypothetical protein